MRRLVLAILVTLAGCGLVSRPTEIPVAGVREPIVRENLAAARAGMPGGLLEPGWVPDGFLLVNADYIKAGQRIESVDLTYDGTAHYLHIWQTRATPAQLGEGDPVPKGVPIEGTDWNADPLPVVQTGVSGVVEFSRRLEDGRTITVDSDLDAATMRRVLDALYLNEG